MLDPSPTSIPADALLERYRLSGAYTDCYSLEVEGEIHLPEYIAAFYTTRLFKLERRVLAALGMPSTDEQAFKLAQGEAQHFAAWKVEARRDSEILLDAGRTRSWLKVEPLMSSPAGTRLMFGSAVVPLRPGGRFGFWFHALLGFHRVYSRLLLSAAARRVLALRKR